MTQFPWFSILQLLQLSSSMCFERAIAKMEFLFELNFGLSITSNHGLAGWDIFSDAISNVYTPVIGTTQGRWTSNQEVTVLLVRDLVRRANRASVSLSYFYRGVLFCYDDKQHLVGWYVGAITHCQGPLRRRLCSRIQFSHRPVIKWGVFFFVWFFAEVIRNPADVFKFLHKVYQQAPAGSWDRCRRLTAEWQAM